MYFLQSIILAIILFLTQITTPLQTKKIKMANKNEISNSKVIKTNEEWKKQLSPLAFKVLREKGTERPYTGIYDNFYQEGTYYCAGCNNKLFESNTKFHSGCGWPSFYSPADSVNIIEIPDHSFGMNRIEIRCSKCDGHLGHVFNDGPKPTGLRYCINSASLRFEPKSNTEEKND